MGTIALLVLVLSIISVSSDVAMGQYLDPANKTNINKVEALFENSMENYQGFQREIETSKESIKSGVEKNSGFGDLVDSSKAQAEATKLAGISENELSGGGKAQLSQDPFYNEMFVDYTKPGGIAHQEDAKLIADASGKMMDNLLGKLKDIGVDCKTAKGNKEIEPQYFMEINRKDERAKGDTIYDRYFCERPRKNYQCSEELQLRCKHKAMQWGGWQARTMSFLGQEAHYSGWLYYVFWKRKRYGGHMSNSKDIRVHIRNKIISKLNVKEEQIGEGLEISARGVGEPQWVTGELFVFPQYIVGYQYRDGIEICAEWNETRQEVCRLE